MYSANIIYPELGNTESSYQMTIFSVRENTNEREN